ncbi:hypothetical protein J2848_006831 [Azospirillum lipoferum]|uniref:hypothetical protein n=1 Tax=Azospirillum TaxID=191 RepID=UPI0014787CA9|nr:MULTISPECIES: hypothetical protein [Azospirillum]MCP1615118.1 hypothetical protein [Azospirillum lipoferum]MDW5533015.1 hypothetical protein [Azospirillum sp. NL1]
MTILCITAATSLLSLGLLAGFDLCAALPSDIAGARSAQSSRQRSGEDMMG